MDKFKADELQLYNKALVDAEQFRDIFDIMNSAVVVFRISEDRQDFIFTDIISAAEKVENITRSQAVGSSLSKSILRVQ